MASVARSELISASEKDIDQLSLVTIRLSDEGKLQDTLSEFSKRQLEDLWDTVLRVCMSTILETDDEDDEKDLNQKTGVLECITTLATGTVAYLRTTNENEDSERAVTPESLQETVIILHGLLPSLTSPEMSQLKNAMCELFEDWWVGEFPCREEVMGHTIVHLLTKSTNPKASQQDVARVWKVHNVLSAIDLSAESSTNLVSLLQQSLHHHQFINSASGIRFLVYLFTLNPRLTEQLHQSLKQHLPATPKSWHGKYGEIYFKAWQKVTDDHKLKIEQDCMQDLMYKAVHSQRDGHNSMASILFRILTYIHKQKTQRGVETMLTRLYEPILWRSLMVANSDVRVNAATIMFDVFPLQNPGTPVQEADQMLQRQFDVMHGLLADSVVEVRLVAVRGVGRVLCMYWELIPLQVIQYLVTTLVQELAFDITSPAVREAVIRVMSQLCDNHLCIPMLKKVLPELRNFVHDTSEKVRHAIFDLLLKVKGLRSIKFWTVVPVEHVLSRLESDTPSICRKIMKLIHSSFVPIDLPPAERIDRCLTLIKSHPGASRQFFVHLPQYLDLRDCVKFIVLLCRYALETARQQRNNSLTHNDSTMNNTNSLDNASLSENSATTKKARPSSKSKRKSEENGANTNGDTASTDEPASEEASQVLKGVLEAIYLMYTAVQEKLRAQKEKEMIEGLAKKLSITVRELMNFSLEKGMDTVLVALAGHLPLKSLPLVSQNLLNRLKKSGSEVVSGAGSEGTVDSAVIIKSLVQWGHADSVLDMVVEALGKVMQSGGEDSQDTINISSSDSTPKETKKKKKKTVGFAVEESSINPNTALVWLVEMLSQVESQPVLLKRHKGSLMGVIQSMQPVLGHIRRFFAEDSITGNIALNRDLMTSIFMAYLRLLTFMNVHLPNTPDEVSRERAETVKSLHGVLMWAKDVLFEHLADPSIGVVRRKVMEKLMESVLKMSHSLMLVSTPDDQLLDQMIDLCMSLSQPSFPYVAPVVYNVLGCLYQITQIRHKQQTVVSDDAELRQQQTQDKRLSTIVNECLCKIMESATQHFVLNMDEDLSREDRARVFSLESAAFNDLFQEQTRPGRDIDEVEVLHSRVVSCCLQELQRNSREDNLQEESGLPPLCAVLLSAVKKRSSNKSMFMNVLDKDLQSLEEEADIHHLHAVIALVTIFKTYKYTELPRSVERSIQQLLTKAQPNGTDEDIFRDLKVQLEEKLKSWNTVGDEEI